MTTARPTSQQGSRSQASGSRTSTPTVERLRQSQSTSTRDPDTLTTSPDHPRCSPETAQTRSPLFKTGQPSDTGPQAPPPR